MCVLRWWEGQFIIELNSMNQVGVIEIEDIDDKKLFDIKIFKLGRLNYKLTMLSLCIFGLCIKERPVSQWLLFSYGNLSIFV